MLEPLPLPSSSSVVKLAELVVLAVVVMVVGEIVVVGGVSHLTALSTLAKI